MPAPNELPEKVDSAKYVAFYDEYGDLKVIDQPAGPGALIWDGQNWRASSQPIEGGGTTPALPVNFSGADTAGVINSIIAADADGKAVQILSGPSDGVMRVLTLSNKTASLKKWFAAAFPTGPDAKGMVIRNALDGDQSGAVTFLRGTASTFGFPILNADGTVSVFNFKDVPIGATLIMGAGSIPAWGTPGAGSGGTGGSVSNTAASGLSDVFATAPTSLTVQVKAPRLSLTSADGALLNAVDINETLDVSTEGEGGIDDGTIAASTWYYVYVIGNTSGDISVVASTDGDAPTLPTGYTHYGLASVFYSTASSLIRAYAQMGHRFWIMDTSYAANDFITTGWTAVNGTVGLASILPPIVKMCSGRMGGAPNEIGHRTMAVACNTSGLGAQGAIMATTGGNDWLGLIYAVYQFTDLPILNPAIPAIYWKSGDAMPATRERMLITGFTI